MQPPPVIWCQPLGDGYCVGSRSGPRGAACAQRRTTGLLFSGRVLSIEAGPDLESARALAEELADNAPDALPVEIRALVDYRPALGTPVHT